MRRPTLILLSAALLLAAPAASSKAPPTPAVALVYRPILKADGSFDAIEVTLGFRGTDAGVTTVDLPDEWGGYRKFYAQISDLQATGAEIVPAANPARLELHHAPGAPISLSYRVKGVDRPDRLRDGENANEYRPIVNRSYFHLIGEAVIAKPEHIEGDTRARFTIEGMPEGASFASDLEHRTADGLTFDRLVESIAVGGDFRIVDAGGGARLALRGGFEKRDDAGWTDSFRSIAAAVSRYWASETGPYLVTILPFEPGNPGSTSIGGTGRGDAFAFFATTNALPDTLDQIMAHEMTHSWVPRRIGGIAEGPKQAEDYWLSEGFTDFAAWRALVRAGIWTPGRYFAEFNAALSEYDRSPYRATPNAEAAALFWNDAAAQRIAYLRGVLFAHELDYRLRQRGKGHSLRAALLAMQTQSKTANADSVVALLRAETARRGAQIDDAISRNISRGETLLLPAGMMAACGELRGIIRPKFHRGFDIEATQAKGGLISGVVEGGRAWQSGMRDGMKLVRRSGGSIGDAMTPIAYDVETGGTLRTFTYLPQSADTETIRLFETRRLDQPAPRKRCLAELNR